METPYLLIGTVDGLVDKLLVARERWGMTHFTVRADALDAFGVVMARVL